MSDPKKRLLFHCSHMGSKENDILFGTFARACVEDLNDTDIADMESLLTNNDVDLLNWVLGKADVPQCWDTPVLRRLQAFSKGRGA